MIKFMNIFTELIRIAALLISFSYVYGRIHRHLGFESTLRRMLFNGVIFSIMGLLVMLHPFELFKGVLIDSRTIIIAYSGLFGGPVAALITGADCAAVRIFEGGAGETAAIVSIGLSVLFGILLYRMYNREKPLVNNLLFASTGIVTALGTIISVFIVVGGKGRLDLVSASIFPFLILYPVMGYLMGALITREIDQAEMETELKNDNDRKRTALAIASDGYFEWNVDVNQFFFDPNYFTIAGYNPDEYAGTLEQWRLRIFPEERPSVEKNLQDFLAGKLPRYDVIYRFRRKDGTWMWIHARAVAMERDKDGSVMKALGTHTDISAYKDAQMELKRLQSAIEHAAESIVVTDENGFIQYINPAFTEMTGYERDEVLGRRTSILKSGEHEPEFYKQIWSVFSSGKSWSGRIRNKRKDGSIYVEEIVISPVFGEDDGTIENYVAIMRDITGDLDLQDQIGQSRKMQALGQLAGGVAHDFNNMLTGIMTATLMLKKRSGLDEKSQKYLGIIDEAVERSAELTRSLLSFSRKRPHLLNIISLHDSIKSMEKLLRSTLDKNITLMIDLFEGKSDVVGDASQIENAVLNLCINASHALESGGVIRITTDIEKFDATRCARDPFELQPGEYIHLAVQDNGEGIAPEHLSKIFDPFFTTKAKSEGTGLGLTAVYTMISQHRGSISVESKQDVGTTFHLYFYRINEEQEIAGKEETCENHVSGEGNILLVDDEVLIRAPLKDMLSDLGYNVRTAENGLAALEIFRENKNEIDLVILDVVMPEMDGLSCLKQLRDLRPDIPVIVETGYAADAKIAGMKELGIQGLLSKPASEALLKGAINEALSSR